MNNIISYHLQIKEISIHFNFLVYMHLHITTHKKCHFSLLLTQSSIFYFYFYTDNKLKRCTRCTHKVMLNKYLPYPPLNWNHSLPNPQDIAEGFEVNFLVHLQLLLVIFFFTRKLIRPLANCFPLFETQGWF